MLQEGARGGTVADHNVQPAANNNERNDLVPQALNQAADNGQQELIENHITQQQNVNKEEDPKQDDQIQEQQHLVQMRQLDDPSVIELEQRLVPLQDNDRLRMIREHNLQKENQNRVPL